VLLFILYLLPWRLKDEAQEAAVVIEGAQLLFSFGLFSDGAAMDVDTQALVDHNVKASGKIPFQIVDLNGALADLRFVENFLPGVLDLFHGVGAKRRVGMSDVARLASAFARGGTYLDLDVFLFRPVPFDPDCVHVFVEHVATGLEGPPFPEKYFERIANFAFSGPRGHPFFLHVLKEIMRRWNVLRVKEEWVDKDVLAVTGPDSFTNVAHEMAAAADAKLRAAAASDATAGGLYLPLPPISAVSSPDVVGCVRVHPKEEADVTFRHLLHGAWRQRYTKPRVFERIAAVLGIRDWFVTWAL